MQGVDPNIVELSVAALAMIVVYRLLGFLQHLMLHKRGINTTPTSLACQSDPMHFQRIREIHAYTQGVQQQIARGDFNCAWRDRDEVRDLLESMRNLTTVMTELVQQMKERKR